MTSSSLHSIANTKVDNFDVRIVAFAFDLARCGINAKTIHAQAHEQFEGEVKAVVIENSIREAARRMAAQHL
ncbi:hypothetical protein BcepSauron_143 [Burkholderia phage BcepSauron]|uniref:Uncharacterized protein n=2 Tax=Sarumanvirus TaxID=2843450 RepID=A0A482MMZ0_9CAUD|nr:hypothetical protein H1O16_gp143 [Burkholderia phage BcepSaruman]YP_009904521.1 hypothetical protein H1O17_gp143 [Burkholderia phage BcepSauron]QBQ74523.1 hypothetical protein BcepSauron_143 [Burkholderia phage BcepSauron]QBX06556.1 hypothetical protein BcepSaruman_143 [Burkholderia phage BcepSaruman]